MTTNATPRRFQLHRHHDVTGASGTGIVADGCLWPDGTASVRWRGDRKSIVHWDSITDAEAIHGHGGHTEIAWLDAADTDAHRLGRIAAAHSKDTGPSGLTSGLCVECDHPHPCPTYVWATTERDPLATWDPADDTTEETTR